MKIQTIALGCVLLLQSAWLLGTTFFQEQALRSGAVVLLKTRPVDPRDLLRGDYVILNYDISSIPRDKFQPPLTNALTYNERVFVVLEQNGEFHEAAFASLNPPQPGTGQVVVAATVDWSQRSDEGANVPLRYGLERFYVQEGTGNPAGELTVEAVVPASGQALIKQVFVDGVPYREAMKQP